MTTKVKSNADGSSTVLVGAVPAIEIATDGKVTFPSTPVPAFIAYQASGTTVPPSVFTKVLFNDDREDTDNAYNPATGVFTVPVAGFYLFSWSVGFQTATVGMTYSQLRKGANLVGFGTSAETNSLGSLTTACVLVKCAVGDAVSVEVFQSAVSGGLPTQVTTTTFSGVFVRKA